MTNPETAGDAAQPVRRPLYEAQNAPRYERQRLIRAYQEQYSCRFMVMIGSIFPDSITPFEETLYDADPTKDLHVMLATLGRDGETALRLVRQAQSPRIWARYFVLNPHRIYGASRIYEGETASNLYVP